MIYNSLSAYRIRQDKKRKKDIKEAIISTVIQVILAIGLVACLMLLNIAFSLYQ